MSFPIVASQFQDDHQILQVSPPSGGVALRGRLRVPGDKSISHRALMVGALATGDTTIDGLLLGEDVQSTARLLRAIGTPISELNSQRVTVQGMGLSELREPEEILDAGNSGTTVRLMLGILASHLGRFCVITGDASLRSRPMDRVIRPLNAIGGQIRARNGSRNLPLGVYGHILHPTDYQSPIASAQVKSALLLAGLMIDGPISVTEPALSRDHTERMLRAFGAKISVEPEINKVTLFGPAWKLNAQPIVVPGDISSAAFWLVAASILPGSELTIENVGINPTRTGILEVLCDMGADITLENERDATGEPVADLRVKAAPLQGCEISGALIPRLVDEIPILAVAATAAQGKTIIRDAAELRVKESDRLAVMAAALGRMGATITEHPDGLEIEGPTRLSGTTTDSYTDHRIAMSLAIAGLLAEGTTTIDRAEAVAVSYPDFIPTLEELLAS